MVGYKPNCDSWITSARSGAAIYCGERLLGARVAFTLALDSYRNPYTAIVCLSCGHIAEVTEC